MSNAKLICTRQDKQIYREGDNLVKVFDENYSKVNILNEALNHAKVEETTDLNVPKLKSVQLVNGKWAIILEYVEGKTLDTLMHEHPEKQDEYLEFFVDLQRQVLSKKVPMLSMLKDKMHGKISSLKNSVEATCRYDLHMRLDSMPKHSNLCHGDFNPSNIIIKDDGTPYIIDWAHATQGNASADVARSYLLFYISGQHELAEEYLKLYCKKSDTAIQYVQRWIPIVAASRLTVAKPEEEAILRKWIDVVEYE
jgi:tRNA A-37 threonylcarbamoyl transferase component Bud32